MNETTNRRDFLKASGRAASSLAMVDLTGLNTVQAEQPCKPKRVELAIATIACDGFGDEDFKYAFDIIPQLPFKNVEFNCWYSRNLTPVGIQSIRDRCRQHRLTPICIQGSSFGASGNSIKDVTHKLWNMEAARQLGCKRVKFTGSGRGSEGGLSAIIQVLKELTPAAEEMGMTILLENHAKNNLETIDDYDQIFSAIPSPNVGMCMDNAHFNGANVDLMAVVERFHSRILHIDLKDTERMGIHKIVRYGQGVTDNAGVVERMLALGYSGYLLVEMAPPIDRTTLEADLRVAYDMFHKYER